MRDRLSGDETPVAWRFPCSVADLERISALDDDTRALVERYAQSRETSAQDASGYERGWEDAMNAARDEIDSIYLPSAPRKQPKLAAGGAT